MRRKKQAAYICFALFAAVCIIASCVRASCVEYTTMEVVVQEGDTLWGIWEEHGYGRGDRWIAEVRSMNNMQSSVIYPYDRLTVPVVKGE